MVKSVVLLLWIFTIFGDFGCVSVYPTASQNPDLVHLAHGPIASILRSTLSARCTIILISDGTAHHTSLKQLSQVLGDRTSLAVLEGRFDLKKQQAKKQLDQLSKHLRQLQTTSSCSMILLMSDHEMLLESVLQEFYRNGLLKWPRKTIVISRVSNSQLLRFEEPLSNTNTMLVNITGKANVRCSIYSYLPYTSQVRHIASWSPGDGFIFHTSYGFFPDKFERLPDGVHLQLIGDHFNPHMIVEINESEEGSFKMSGPLMTVVDILASSMNFKRPPDGSWGYVLPNMTATGMVGALARKEVDIGLGPFGVTENRAQVMDYSMPWLVDYIAIAAKLGNPEVDIWGFVMPWAPSVWISIFVALCGILCIILAIFYAKEDEQSANMFNYIRILLQQGITMPDNRLWERIILLSWAITTMVLIKGYSGNLMSQLAVRYIPQPYQSIFDVVQDEKVTMIWEPNSVYYHTFMNAKTGTLSLVREAALAGKIKYVKSSKLSGEFGTSVLQGDHVVMVELSSLKIIMARLFSKKGDCQFYIGREKLMPFLFGIAFQKNSPLKNAVDKRLITMMESGIYTHLTESFVPNSTTCVNAPKKTVVRSTLSISKIWGMYMILLVGDAAALAILAMEWCCNKTREEGLQARQSC